MRSNVDLLLVLVLSLGLVAAQSARASASRPLPQWLTGIIGVVGFLFLAFVALLIKHAWCTKPKRNFQEVESKENEYVMQNGSQPQRRGSGEIPTYVNLGADTFEDKVTAM